MGGDFAPAYEVEGAVQAVRESDHRFEIVLVGREADVRPELQRLGAGDGAVTIVHASEVVGMQESPVEALRKKTDSSLVVGVTLHKEGKADAFVSTGNTGAVTAASTLILGRIPHVSRPTIAAVFPSESGPTLLVDAGAVTDAKPHFLYEFGVMGRIYAEYIIRKKNPRVALLNIGEEEIKGDERAKEAYHLMARHRDEINFIGNVEGRGILKGDADVIVCDGFLGNILLKFGESVPSFLKTKFRNYANEGPLQKLLMAIMRGPLRKIFKDFDYEEFGGVPLLGVNGVTIIGHGRSTPKAIKNMIFRAEEMVEKRINHHIEQSLKGHHT